MTTQFIAVFRQPTHLMAHVDSFLNLAEDWVDSEFDSDFSDLTLEPMPRPTPNEDRAPKRRSTPNPRRPAARSRGLAEVAAEASIIAN